jgi:hypothetical protein
VTVLHSWPVIDGFMLSGKSGPGTVLDAVRSSGGSRLTGDGRLSELLAPNRPVRYAFQRQQSGVDLVYMSTRHRPVPDLRSWSPKRVLEDVRVVIAIATNEAPTLVARSNELAVTDQRPRLNALRCCAAIAPASLLRRRCPHDQARSTAARRRPFVQQAKRSRHSCHAHQNSEKCSESQGKASQLQVCDIFA